MFKWIKDVPQALAIVGSIVPLIQLLVRTAETPGMGPQKKAEVIKGIKNTLEELNVTETLQDLVLTFVGGVIEVYVWVQNVIGFFVHKKE